MRVFWCVGCKGLLRCAGENAESERMKRQGIMNCGGKDGEGLKDWKMGARGKKEEKMLCLGGSGSCAVCLLSMEGLLLSIWLSDKAWGQWRR